MIIYLTYNELGVSLVAYISYRWCRLYFTVLELLSVIRKMFMHTNDTIVICAVINLIEIYDMEFIRYN